MCARGSKGGLLILCVLRGWGGGARICVCACVGRVGRALLCIGEHVSARVLMVGVRRACWEGGGEMARRIRRQALPPYPQVPVA
jgi:hypothetical protein